MDPTGFVIIGALCLASALLIAALLSGGRQTERRIDQRLVRIERALDRLERGLPPPDHTAEHSEIRALLGRGRTIEAIKRYREQTGAGLREARDAVHAIGRGERP